MSVNFKGVKNVGGLYGQSIHGNVALINMELTNKDGPDKDNFETILKTYPNATNHNFVNFMYGKIGHTENYILNGKPLKVCDTNLGIFEKLAKLLTRTKNETKPLELNKDYINSNDCKIMMQDCLVTKDTKTTMPEQLKGMHDDKYVKSCAETLTNKIQRTMERYFNIK